MRLWSETLISRWEFPCFDSVSESIDSNIDARQANGRIFGIFVGISDYAGRIIDLDDTATDAT